MTMSTNVNVSSTTPSTSKLPQAALVGAILSMIGNMVILFVGRGLGTQFMLVPPGGTDLEAIPFFPVIMAASIMPAIGAAILLYVLARTTERPYLAFWTIAGAFLLLSFWAPLNTLTDSSQTAIGLNIMHAWSALSIVGALTVLGNEEA